MIFMTCLTGEIFQIKLCLQPCYGQQKAFSKIELLLTQLVFKMFEQFLLKRRSVEAIGVDRVCSRIPPLPVALHSHFAGRLRDRVVVCGGNDGIYER
jgi:hypothetical protein